MKRLSRYARSEFLSALVVGLLSFCFAGTASAQYNYETEHKAEHKAPSKEKNWEQFDHSKSRQFYSDWKWNSEKKYHFRKYFFKPTVESPKHKYHYAIYVPEKPKHIFFYNPHKKHYWGRCPIDSPSKYAILPPKHRKPKLTDIPDHAFPQWGPLPPIPDSKDGQAMVLPPNDLPEI